MAGGAAISCWEVAMLVARGRLAFSMDVGEWIERALQLPGIRLAELTPRIAVLSTRLPGSPPPDPADRILLATAMDHKTDIGTKDRTMRRYPHVRTVW